MEYGQPEPQGVRRFPDKDRVKMGSEREASDHTGGSSYQTIIQSGDVGPNSP